MKAFLSGIAILAILMLAIPLVAMRPAGHRAQTAAVSVPSRAVGAFRVTDEKSGSAYTLDAFNYVCGVVANEEPSSFHTEALKAQAVAAFTYAVYRNRFISASSSAGASPSVFSSAATPSSILFSSGLTSESSGRYITVSPSPSAASGAGRVMHISADDGTFVWGTDTAHGYEKIRGAVRAVENKILVYEGKPIAAVFCSMSSGKTESSKDVWGTDLPYLQEVSSFGDTLSPSFESTASFQRDQVKSAVSAKYPNADFSAEPSKWLTKVTRSKAGGVVTATLCGVSLRGTEIRSLFGLRSTNFTVTYKNGTFTFHVKGFGHGVGLSQNGSDYMAMQGKKWDEILKWYYPGAQIADFKWA